MHKHNVKNFDEFCALRKFYNDLLYTDGTSEDIHRAIQAYGVGNTDTCTLCVAAIKAADEDEDKCDCCMWNLVDTMVYYPCMSILDGLEIDGIVLDSILLDIDLDAKTQLKERIEAMDYLIAEYENME
jgi:hypothetical protein